MAKVASPTRTGVFAKGVGTGEALAALYALAYVVVRAISQDRLDITSIIVPAVALFLIGFVSDKKGWITSHRSFLWATVSFTVIGGVVVGIFVPTM